MEMIMYNSRNIIQHFDGLQKRFVYSKKRKRETHEPLEETMM